MQSGLAGSANARRFTAATCASAHSARQFSGKTRRLNANHRRSVETELVLDAKNLEFSASCQHRSLSVPSILNDGGVGCLSIRTPVTRRECGCYRHGVDHGVWRRWGEPRIHILVSLRPCTLFAFAGWL
jgi:hypothetical protein